MNNIICIAGPTASGKTALAVEIAKRTGGEVVSCTFGLTGPEAGRSLQYSSNSVMAVVVSSASIAALTLLSPG